MDEFGIAARPAPRDVGLGRRPLLRVVGRRLDRCARDRLAEVRRVSRRRRGDGRAFPHARRRRATCPCCSRCSASGIATSWTLRVTRCFPTTTTSRASRPTCSSSRWRATASRCAAAASPSNARHAPSFGASRAPTPSTPSISCCIRARSACRSISCCPRVRPWGARISRISRPRIAWHKAWALAEGDPSERPGATRSPHQRYPGSRPSSLLLFERLDAATLGKLVALYEHKVYVQGVIWDVNSFDQWGVQLGKRLASQLAPAVTGGTEAVPRAVAGALAALARAQTRRVSAAAARSRLPCRYLCRADIMRLSAEALCRMLARTAFRSRTLSLARVFIPASR